MTDMRSPQTTTTADQRHQSAGNKNKSDDIVSKHVDNLVTGSQEEARPTLGAKATCHPMSHIVFLKTHKTASSTIFNILYRYGESRNLTFALPRNRDTRFSYPNFFAPHFVEGVSSGSVREFHIMCNHMRFRKSEVSSSDTEVSCVF